MKHAVAQSACKKIMPKKAVKNERKLENLNVLCNKENASGQLGLKEYDWEYRIEN